MGKKTSGKKFDEVELLDRSTVTKAISTPSEIFKKAEVGKTITYMTEDGTFQITKICNHFGYDRQNTPGIVRTTEEIESEADEAFRMTNFGMPPRIPIADFGIQYGIDARKRYIDSMLKVTDFTKPVTTADELFDKRFRKHPKETMLGQLQELKIERNKFCYQVVKHKQSLFDFMLGSITGMIISYIGFYISSQ